MKIAIDVDGVLYEWDKTARYMLRTYREAKHMEHESSYWNSIQQLVSKEDWHWLWTEGVRLGLFRYGHVVRGAIVGVRRLARDDHELIAVTSRPKTAVRDTMAWFNYVDLPFASYHILPEGPKTLIEADVLIDDKPENITDWLNDGRDAIMFGRAWNQAYDARFYGQVFARVNGWDEVVATVRGINEFRAAS